MTVFRQFGTKKGVLEAAIRKYSYVPSFKKIFDKELVYKLERDLYLIATSYLNLMESNMPIFLIEQND
jgi:TetR/AcrR family transcriptional regulator, mexJK operon transcriptional repressor